MVTKQEFEGVQGYRIERLYEPSAIRRGRTAVDPVWIVHTPDGGRERFLRQRDARAFIARRIDEDKRAKALDPWFDPSTSVRP